MKRLTKAYFLALVEMQRLVLSWTSWRQKRQQARKVRRLNRAARRMDLLEELAEQQLVRVQELEAAMYPLQESAPPPTPVMPPQEWEVVHPTQQLEEALPVLEQPTPEELEPQNPLAELSRLIGLRQQQT